MSNMRDWIREKLIETNFSKQDVINSFPQACEELDKDLMLTSFERSVRFCYNEILDDDNDIVEGNLKLAKQKQKLQDTNRIERKTFRNHARVDNALVELNGKLVTLLENNNVSEFTKVHNNIDVIEGVAIVHLTDHHLNELINLPHNKYDFVIASKRLKKYIKEVKRFLSPFDIQTVVVVFGGDMINSDRRLDEILAQATNRSKALFLAVQLYEQVLIDLNKDYNVQVFCVSGNESRLKKDIGYNDMSVTDNYDFCINEMLRIVFKGSEGVIINPFCGMEKVITIKDKNFLIIHGLGQGKNTESYVQDLFGKYASMGTIINFVILGHLHGTKSGDFFGRGSGLPGANGYSHNGLHLISRSAQNLHIVTDNDIHTINIDLQNYSNDQYQLNEQLKKYNVTNHEKLQRNNENYKIDCR